MPGVLYFWDKRENRVRRRCFDDDICVIFEDENDDSDRDYVTLDIGEEEGTEAKEESTETSKEE